MDKESVDFKILGEMQQGSMITVVFEDDTKVTGVVLNKFYVTDSYNEENGYYLVRLQINGEHETQINSDDIKEIERCTTCDAGLVTGRAAIEKYGISCDRCFDDIITEVVNKWDELEGTAKDEISKVVSSSMNWVIARNILNKRHMDHVIYEECQKVNDKLIALNDSMIKKQLERTKDIATFLKKYAEIRECLTDEYRKILDYIIFEYCGLDKVLK